MSLLSNGFKLGSITINEKYCMTTDQMKALDPADYPKVFPIWNTDDNCLYMMYTQDDGTVVHESLKDMDWNDSPVIMYPTLIGDGFLSWELRYLGDDGSIPTVMDVRGKSAYQIWTELGNEGSEEDFIASLKGEQGESAYDAAKTSGYEGTQDEWLESLKGKSIYELAVASGYSGTVEEYLDSIRDKSLYDMMVDTGYTGTQEEWITSMKGKSAYDVAVDGGYEGTAEEWLASLKGNDGKSIYDMALDNGYDGTEADFFRELNYFMTGAGGSYFTIFSYMSQPYSEEKSYYPYDTCSYENLLWMYIGDGITKSTPGPFNADDWNDIELIDYIEKVMELSAVEIYDQTKRYDYTKGDYVYDRYGTRKIYKCIVDDCYNSDDLETNTDWECVGTNLSDAIQKVEQDYAPKSLVIKDYDETATYEAGAMVLYEGMIYSLKMDSSGNPYHTPGDFNPDHWSAVADNFADTLGLLFTQLPDMVRHVATEVMENELGLVAEEFTAMANMINTMYGFLQEMHPDEFTAYLEKIESQNSDEG